MADAGSLLRRPAAAAARRARLRTRRSVSAAARAPMPCRARRGAGARRPAELDGRAGRLIERALCSSRTPARRFSSARRPPAAVPCRWRGSASRLCSRSTRRRTCGRCSSSRSASSTRARPQVRCSAAYAAAAADAAHAVTLNVACHRTRGGGGRVRSSSSCAIRPVRSAARGEAPREPLSPARRSDAADSMLPGRRFAAGETVQVMARIARCGSPVGASGDPFGEISYLVGRDGLVDW